MARIQIPLVFDGSLLLLDKAEGRQPAVPVGSAAWYTWLADRQNLSFSFRNDFGTFTARCEQQRQGRYWYAYRKYEGKLLKVYLGK